MTAAAAAAVCASINKSIPQASFASQPATPVRAQEERQDYTWKKNLNGTKCISPTGNTVSMATLDIFACHKRLDKWPKNWRRKNNVKRFSLPLF